MEWSHALQETTVQKTSFAARAATIAGGHLYFIPKGSFSICETNGNTPLTARKDFAIGQLPVANQSDPIAS